MIKITIWKVVGLEQSCIFATEELAMAWRLNTLPDSEYSLETLSWLEDRIYGYNAKGITIEKLIVDLWERVVEGRPAASETTQIDREKIKSDFPKPV